MSWWTAARTRHRRRKLNNDQHSAIESASAPPPLHPVLGLGGRSIELSLAQGTPADPAAFTLAVDELHDHIQTEQTPRSELRAAGHWLAALAEHADMPRAAREVLSRDLDTLSR